MKIGILTLPLHSNYGGNLQAFALMNVLRDLGHEPWLLSRARPAFPMWRIPLALAKRVIKKFVLRREGIVLRHGLLDKHERAVIEQHARRFITAHIQPQTRASITSLQLAEQLGAYAFEAVVVGSDQVWRPRYAGNITDSFCGFIPETDSRTRRVAYAASFGTDDWPLSPAQTVACATLARRFDAISVREDSGVNLCRAHLGVAAEQVLDPTLLLEPVRYLQLLSEDGKRNRGVMSYVLDEDPEKQEWIALCTDKLGLPVFKVGARTENIEAPLAERVAPPVEDWLRGFRDADFVVTDSFHGTAFSILFNKSFIAIGNPGRGIARFTSLLKLFGLEERLVISPGQSVEDIVTKSIDWASVNAALDAERVKALSFLRNALADRGRW